MFSVLARDLTVTPWASAQVLPDTFTVPAGSKVELIRNASGLEGDLWAVADTALIVRLSGNDHDPKYRHVFVPLDAVESVSYGFAEGEFIALDRDSRAAARAYVGSEYWRTAKGDPSAAAKRMIADALELKAQLPDMPSHQAEAWDANFNRLAKKA
jgi:hypothetical protein